MNFKDIPNITAGVYSAYYNATAVCLPHALNPKYKRYCMSQLYLEQLGALIFLQGVPVSVYEYDSIGVAFNHTLLRSGHMDTCTAGTNMLIDNSRDFYFTTPYLIEKYGVLMKRRKYKNNIDFYNIDFDSVTAGIGGRIYAILFSILFAYVVVSCVNERFQQGNERNTIWHILLSIFPSNGQMWPYQAGVARKCLLTTCGFIVLSLSSLYQAKQAEVLMIPQSPPVFTLTDIEENILSGGVLLGDEAMFNYVPDISRVLEVHASDRHRAHAFDLMQRYPFQTLIDDYNGIFIYTENFLLNHIAKNIPQHMCDKYVFITFDEWTRIYSAFILRKQRVDILESMNVIIAERMAYVDAYIQSPQLSDECHKEIFPVYTPNARFASLTLGKISGALVFLLLCLLFAVGVFIIEVMMFKNDDRATKNNESCMVELQFKVVNDVEVVRKIRFTTYLDILALIERCEGDS
jgi:hypothetical protein